jgi:choline transport protein
MVGPVAVVWGLIATAIRDLCLASSSADFLSAYPTAGGQYHWVAILSTERYAKHLAWVTGWISVFGWMAVAASGSLLTSQLFLGLIASVRKTDQPSGSEYFACYIGVTVTAFAANCKFNGILPSLNKAAFLWSILSYHIASVETSLH